MPLRSDWSGKSCPIARGLEVLGDPWSMMVLREVFFGNTRFGDIQARIGIADSVLSKRLLWLSDTGLLEKTPYDDGGRTRNEYRLTTKGEGVLPVLNAVAQWADKHLEPPHDEAHMRVIHTGCGEETTSADTCTHCGTSLDASVTSWHSLTRSEAPIRLATALGQHR
ncbi:MULTISPECIES: winged helix-turn-helix transcriptional regulator [unclassified Arthrobacter]|uniref:winged helix-turn-helix transcriptional regulator n=1 Tax=unclassified Arthrobacter TaxID=235627 RepID=UPI001491FD73|nr:MULTISPECIES: helix-turn-helix domain-containing protein [unclassified Arthrobacter]MBE0010532.1 transcriptional regulator [Arthrobacter sp. AET 35A]NOJ64341.1 helix-turn-helix transcriptional regulator [Arthrobacter sp. 147(2020)]